MGAAVAAAAIASVWPASQNPAVVARSDGLSFLHINDVGAVWFTCQALRGAVVRFLNGTRTLEFDAHDKIDIGSQLAFAHCQSLSHIHVPSVSPSLLLTIEDLVIRNKATLRVVRVDHCPEWSDSVIDALLQARSLEHFDVSVTGPEISAALLERLTPDNLPALTALRIACNRSTDEALRCSTPVETLLSRGLRVVIGAIFSCSVAGFRLQALDMRLCLGITKTVLNCFNDRNMHNLNGSASAHTSRTAVP